MSNTLPILGTNNLGLTFKLPKWDHRLRYSAGSVVLHDTDSDSDSVDYRLFMNPRVSKGPFTVVGTNAPDDDSDWNQIAFTS